MPADTDRIVASRNAYLTFANLTMIQNSEDSSQPVAVVVKEIGL